MRLKHSSALVMLFLFSSLLVAQKVKPTSLSFVGVLGYPGPQFEVAFDNTGDNPLTLTVGITGPFAIPVNDCGRGVRPGTHCNVWVTYTPQAVGDTETGVLTLTYGEGQSVTVSLSGIEYTLLPTSLNFISQRDIWFIGRDVKVEVFVYGGDGKDGYGVPPGTVYFSCINGQETVNLEAGIGPSCHHHHNGHCPLPLRGIAASAFTPDAVGLWQCVANYPGDGLYGPSSSNWEFMIKPRP